MSGNTYYWTKDNAYCIVLNNSTKILSIDFFPSNVDKGKYSILLSNIKFLRHWHNPATKSLLIVLKDATYLYIKDKIITFKLESGDMVIRQVSSRCSKFTAVMTRFRTLLFNDECSLCHVISKENLRPPEFNIGFLVDDSFDTKYASIFSDFTVLHDAKTTRLLLANNL